MKTSLRPLFLSATIALGFTLTFAVFAQEIPKADPAVPAAAEKSDTDRQGLRRLDQPEKSEASPAGKRRDETRGRSGNRDEFPVGDHAVPPGAEVREAISFLGATTVDGTVRADAVSIGGDTRVGSDGKVGGAAVAIVGRAQVDGEVRRDAVSLLGGVTVNGAVRGAVVSIIGDVHLGPKAVVGRDVVIIGGRLIKEPGAVVQGKQIKILGLGALGSVDGLTTWLKECAFKCRPLGFGPHLGWAWLVALSFLGFYLLLALIFPQTIEKYAVTFETRPGGSILAAVLTVLLSPVATVLLALTIVGMALVPFLAAGLFFAGLFGKAVMMAWIGRRVTKAFGGGGVVGRPVFAVLIGGVLVMLLYTVWGSFLLYKLISWLGLGVVVYTIALSMKREKPARPAGMVPPVAAPAITMTAPAPASVSPGFGGASAVPGPAETGLAAGLVAEPPLAAMGAASPGVAPVLPPLVPPATEIAANALPRAGFFLRLGALAIDGILIGMIVGFISGLLPRFLQFGHGPGGVLLALAVYGAIMWKHKGTTIGGIVCGLKVVRLDNRELDWATAIVRALGCFLSLVTAGLGFIWVAFDDEKQSWHDKIAGTTVVIVPKGVSLL